MALKVLMLRKKIDNKNKALEELRTKLKDFETREAELAAALNEAETDEEISTVEDSIKELDEEKTAVEADVQAVEDEVTEFKAELAELETAQRSAEPAQRTAQPKQQTRTIGGSEMKVNKLETRSQMLERLGQEEVREFYTSISTAATNKRALTETEIIIPEVVLDVVQTLIGDYSKLYNEVNVVQLNGTARVIMDGKIPEAIWTEMCDPVQELATGFSQTELDGFKVGGFIPVCNALLEDSMIALANYVEDRLAKAIAKSVDKAILIGEGASAKQPEGIITAIGEGKIKSSANLKEIVGHMGKIDDGEDGVEIGEVVAVMKRSTYYEHIMPQTFLSTADGRLTVQKADGATLPDGTRVVFSQYTPKNTIVLGDLKHYLLGERAGVKLAVSTDVRFIQDQTVFKGTARYDGKVVDKGAFVVIEIEETELP